MKITNETMSIEDWIKVQDNPIQRDTASHARKAAKHNLRESSPTHSVVSAAKVNCEGALYKLDGHTRSYLWDEGILVPDFDSVSVTLYHVDTVAEAEKLYLEFDNCYATETAKDHLTGLFRVYNFRPTSNLLLHGAVISSCRYLYLSGVGSTSNQKMKVDVHTIIPPFLEILTQIDKFGFNKLKIQGSHLVCMLLSLYLDRNALDFWRDFHDHNFNKNDKGDKHASLILYEYTTDVMLKGLNMTRPTKSHHTFIQGIWGIYSGWRNSPYLSRRPSPLSLSPVFESPEFQLFLSKDPLSKQRIDN